MKSLPKSIRNVKGFTLIELLVVIGILAILLSIVLIAINPARQFGQANNTRRQSDVTAILNAIGAYSADHAGDLPTGIPVGSGSAVMIGNGTGQADLCSQLVTNYMPALPTDPQFGQGTTGVGSAVTDCSSAYNTDYTVYQDASHRVTVSAPDAQNGALIYNTR